MTYATTLIDKAAELMPLSRLADTIGESDANLRAMRRGARPMPPHIAARLAELVGDDPRQAALTVVCMREQDADKRAHLARVLRVPASALACALMLVGAPAESRADTALSSAIDSGSVYYVKYKC